MSEVTAVNHADSEIKVAAGSPRLETPLHHVELVELTQPSQRPTVFIEELKAMSHLVLRGNADNPAFIDGVQAALGLALPLAPGSSVQADALRVCWQSPDEWLLIGEPEQAGAIEAALREHLSGHYAVTDVSGGQTLVSLSGLNAENVLRKSTPYDVHVRHFPAGKVIGTTLAKSQVQLRRTGEQSFELILRRSFADYLWMWLVDASQEYGVSYRR
ncbi:sarcosine oxidase subunit gamma [Photobacterium atrarenae]|uniref:Sarcosine oxidase subunit gamma family protein n=1 Tax=Photobacterium atrarenae TaxID=865757 RepID=A0ABY5GMX6_9GAMM|nr:sarcosine oxidase subunit gamma family protein [Photobacterium atrarenae]UTV30496.1 sarcosine oxidase subunit gamma family protein [Photobacterium atrarenae]